MMSDRELATSAPSTPATPAATPAWEDRVADRIEVVVEEVRRRTYSPLKTLATVVVFGILIVAMVSLATVLLVIGASRLLNSYAFPHHIWASYLVIGGILSLFGLLLWSKRR